jgi:hypothetical protein
VREADHSPASSAEVKNGEIIPPLPPCLHGVVRNYAQGQLYLFYLKIARAVGMIVSEHISPCSYGNFSVSLAWHTAYIYVARGLEKII